MIAIHQYFGDRQSKYRLECSESIKHNANKTVEAVNNLLALFYNDTKIVIDNVASGWRPACVNDATANSAKASNHLMALACDVVDANRKFAQWCIDNQNAMTKCKVWMEDPRWTPTWVHLQIVPPKSGKRIFIPNNTQPKAPALRGQKQIPMTIK